MIFTQEMIDEIKYRLSLSGAKDTQFPKIDLQNNPIKGNETITLVKDGVNCRITMEALYEDIANYVGGGTGVSKEDFFNVSVYLGRLSPEEVEYVACTLQEAIEACPNYIQKNGQVIVFLDSQDNKWKAYQKTDTTKEWLDVEAFTVFHLANFITINDNLNPGDEGYVYDSPEIGVTQLAAQEAINHLQNELNQLISQTVEVFYRCYTNNNSVLIYVNDSNGKVYVHVDTEKNNIPMDSIQILRDGEEVYTRDYKTVEYDWFTEETSNTPKTVTYNTKVKIAGVAKNLGNTVISFVYPIHYGAGQSWEDAIAMPSTPKANTTGSYSISVRNNEDYVFFLVPSNLNSGKLGRVTLNDFEMPFEDPVDVVKNGVDYKSYKSSNSYNAGVLDLRISNS